LTEYNARKEQENLSRQGTENAGATISIYFLSSPSICGDLPITLACESASLDVVYTLLRDYAEVVPS